MRNYYQILFSCFLLVSFIALPAVRAQQVPDLATLMQRAVNKDVELANKQLDVEQSKDSRQALSDAYLPRVSSLASYAYLNSTINASLPSSTFPILNIPVPALDGTFNMHNNTWLANVSVKALLFDGFKIGNYKKALTEKMKAQTVILENDRQEIIGKVSETYDMLALLKQSKVVLDYSDKQLQAQSKIADKALSYGLITKYEHKKIEVARAQLLAKLAEYDGKRNLVLKRLEQLTGIGIDTLRLIDNSLVPYLNVVPNQNVSNRPEFAALEAQDKAYNYQLKAKRNHLVPTAAAFGSVSYMNLSNLVFQNKAGTLGPNTGDVKLQMNKLQMFPMFIAGVGVKWDIFDGFESKHEIKKIKIELQQVRNKKEEAKELLSLGLIKANTDYSIASAQIAAKGKEKEVSFDALTIATKEFRTGLIKPADLIAAITDSEKAELGYLETVFNQRRAAVEVHKAAGNLTIDKFK
ncbi:outer membrane protein TolC [Pedobacter cryoconitis]|uniref:Outer membrane protein TolC n=1 Tax=Pedobacter cryoconitis TaxID=188932 RepID=A0A7W8ZJD8_9SPHI|nr:TolC family protein [Pedobacter cryoconitis]MBB5635134.1 outer membrane protein TolC [Pedobacter cryoconitis]MBB6271682.1 outer membrane protein TolC [Pedobacter cryoconitis]